MSGKNLEKRPRASSSASLDERPAQRALPPGLNPPVPHSQTAFTLSAKAGKTKPAPKRQSLSLNDVDDVSSNSDDSEPTSPKIKRDTLLALLYELEDDYLGGDVRLTASRCEELQRRQVWVEELRQEFNRQVKTLPVNIDRLRFEKRFLSYYDPFTKCVEEAVNRGTDAPPPGKPSRLLKGLRQRSPQPDINGATFDRFLPRIERFEAMTVDRRGTAEVQAQIAALRASYLRALVDLTDVRYVGVTRDIRRRLLELINN